MQRLLILLIGFTLAAVGLSSPHICSTAPVLSCPESHQHYRWFFLDKACVRLKTCNTTVHQMSKKSCEEKCTLGCPKPLESTNPFIPNALITVTKTFHRNIYSALFVCGNGYTLMGSSQLTCKADGKWSGEQPFCYRVKLTAKHGNGEWEEVNGDIIESDDGEKLRIQCTVEQSLPANNILSWKCNGNSLPINWHDTHESVVTSNSIMVRFDRLSGVHTEHPYTCEMSPQHLSRSFHIKIAKKDYNYIPATILAAKIDKNKAKDKLTLKCISRGTPLPKVTWRKDGEILNFQHQLMIVDDIVIMMIDIPVTGSHDAGIYVCHSSNSDTSVQQQIEITENDIKIPPLPEEQNCLCPKTVPVATSCKGLKTVIKARVLEQMSPNNFSINGTVIKLGMTMDNVTLGHIDQLQMTEKAMACNCKIEPNSQYIFAGDVEQDKLIVDYEDFACTVNDYDAQEVEQMCTTSTAS